jgi:hypothetical protein
MFVEHDLEAELVGVLVLIEVPVIEIMSDLRITISVGQRHAHGPVPLLYVIRYKGVRHFGKMIR